MPGTYTRTVTIDANNNNSGSPDYSWVVVPASAQKTAQNPSGWVELSATSGTNGSSTNFIVSDNTGGGATPRSCEIKAQHWNYANDNTLEASFTIYQSAAGETTTSSTTSTSSTTTSTSTTTQPTIYSITFSGTGSTLSDPIIFDGNDAQGQLVAYTLSGGSGQAQYVSGKPSYLNETISLQNVSLQLSPNTSDWPTAGESFEILYRHSAGGNTDSIYGQFIPADADTIYLDVALPPLVANPGNGAGVGKMSYALDMSGESTTSSISLGVQLDPDVDIQDTVNVFWSTSSTGATSTTVPYWIVSDPNKPNGIEINNENDAYGGTGDTYQALVEFVFKDPLSGSLPTGPQGPKNEPYVEEGAVAQTVEIVGDESAGTMYLIIQNPNNASNYASVYVTAPSGAITTSTTTAAPSGTFDLQYSSMYFSDEGNGPNTCSGTGSSPTDKFRIGGIDTYSWGVPIQYTGAYPAFTHNATRPVGVNDYPVGDLQVTFQDLGSGYATMNITTPAQTGSGGVNFNGINYWTIAVSTIGNTHTSSGNGNFHLRHDRISC